jgi:hypothetical protein
MIDRFHTDPRSRLDGARDWLDSDDRMRFIVSYLMTYQNDPRMFTDTLPKPPPVRKATEFVVACTQWVSRRMPLLRLIDPTFERLAQAMVEPELAEIGELRS